jgi:chemotaxis protein MotB
MQTIYDARIALEKWPVPHDEPNSHVADEPTNRRISILVLNKAAEQAFFQDGGRTTLDESSPVNAALPAVTASLQASSQPALQPTS